MSVAKSLCTPLRLRLPRGSSWHACLDCLVNTPTTNYFAGPRHPRRRPSPRPSLSAAHTAATLKFLEPLRHSTPHLQIAQAPQACGRSADHTFRKPPAPPSHATVLSRPPLSSSLSRMCHCDSAPRRARRRPGAREPPDRRHHGTTSWPQPSPVGRPLPFA